MSTLSADLLAQAAHLAQLDANRPKQANLRRAISSAYYALFHFLIHESSRQLAGSANDRETWRTFTSRAFDHGKMKTICVEFTKHTPRDILQPFWSSLNITQIADLKVLAEAFIRLQELRHQADYDLSLSFNRQEALAAWQISSDAMQAWRRLRQHHAEASEFFCLVLLIWPMVEKRK